MDVPWLGDTVLSAAPGINETKGGSSAFSPDVPDSERAGSVPAGVNDGVSISVSDIYVQPVS